MHYPMHNGGIITVFQHYPMHNGGIITVFQHYPMHNGGIITVFQHYPMHNGGIITVFQNVDLKSKFLYLSTLRSARIIYIYIYIYQSFTKYSYLLGPYNYVFKSFDERKDFNFKVIFLSTLRMEYSFRN